MRTRLSLSVLCLVFTASCVPVPVPADLESVDLTLGEVGEIEPGQRTVVLASDELTPPPDLLACVRTSIKDTAPEFPLLEAGKFRDALFPWFEPSVVPKQQVALTKTLGRIDVREAVDLLSVKYLVLVGDVTSVAGDIEGPWGPLVMIPAGVGWSEETADMAASIWDLTDASSVGTLAVRASGDMLVATWLVSVVFIPRTVSKACDELGRQLALFLTGQQVSDPEPEPAQHEPSR